MSAEMIQSIVEIMESAHSYKYELTEVLDGIQSLKNQINSSSDSAHKQVDSHFASLKKALVACVEKRCADLKSEIERIRESELRPLEECQTLVEDGLKSASYVMDEGAHILSDEPEKHMDQIVKFKENPKTKTLSSVPAIPTPAEVACVNVVLSHDIEKQLESVLVLEGRVLARAPVQVADIEEKPGSLLVHWSEEGDEDIELSEFWLQYAMGSYCDPSDLHAVFHTAYVGTSTSYLVKHLRTNTAYTFRVCGRGESHTPWSAWSIPRIASTSICHYQWETLRNTAYSLNNENKTATRLSDGLTHILYSDRPSFLTGNTLTFKVLDDADKSPGDGLCISVTNKSTDTFGLDGVLYINLYGSVFVDGQEMTMKLPEIKKGSIVAVQAESLPKSKVRVTIQTEDREVTFDWKIEGVEKADNRGDDSKLKFYFGIRFSQEDWKIAVD